MACPYFYPLEPRRSLGGVQNAMLPLGDLWAGQCRAVAGQPCEPADGDLRPLCNLGYARGTCGRFPAAQDGPDAVRFNISSDEGSLLRIDYVMERDHHPFAHGPLKFSISGGDFSNLPPGENFGKQARAYVESYLRRKAEAARP
jgi:hypothetical protein